MWFDVIILIIQAMKKLYDLLFLFSLRDYRRDRTSALNLIRSDRIRSKFSSLSQIILNLVKKIVIEMALWLREDTSICKSEIRERSHWEYLVFQSFHMSIVIFIHIMLCLIGERRSGPTRNNHIVAMTLCRERMIRPFSLEMVPRTNSTLFLTLSIMMTKLFHEW